MIEMRVKLDAGASLPTKAYPADGGYDLRAKSDMAFTEIRPKHSKIFDTGVHMEIPAGYVGLVLSKSGLDINHDLVCTSVIDAEYSGSIRVKLYNLGEDPWYFDGGDKVGQIVIVEAPEIKLVEVPEISGGARGNK